jgi:hypothetical protein
MGTNYYVAKNLCDCCKRHDEEYHIGKSSGGWAFTFQGYKYDGLVSWKYYKEFLQDKIIMNEYGERIDYDWFVHFIETVKSPSYVNPDNGNKNHLHNDAARKSGYFNPEHDWVDEDGYSFSDREFS